MHTVTDKYDATSWLVLNFNGAWDGDMHLNWKGGEAWCDTQALLAGAWRPVKDRLGRHTPPPIEILGRAIALAVVTFCQRTVENVHDDLTTPKGAIETVVKALRIPKVPK